MGAGRAGQLVQGDGRGDLGLPIAPREPPERARVPRPTIAVDGEQLLEEIALKVPQATGDQAVDELDVPFFSRRTRIFRGGYVKNLDAHAITIVLSSFRIGVSGPTASLFVLLHL
jgi:hypothetical protein